MSDQPLLFLGDKRRDALVARMAERLRSWRRSWADGSSTAFEVVVDAPKVGGFAAPVAAAMTHCWALDLNEQRLAVLLLPHSTYAWAVQEGDAMAIDSASLGGDGALAELLEQEIAQSLLMEFCQLERREEVSVRRVPADAIAGWSREARAWIFHAHAIANGRGFDLLLPSARVEMLAPTRARSSGALHSRREAVGSNTIAVRALVGEVSMRISDLADLAIDDVLVLDQALAEQVKLIASRSGEVIAAGNPGRAGPRRAIKLAGIPVHRS
jgi:hypothetical protein